MIVGRIVMCHYLIVGGTHLRGSFDSRVVGSSGRQSQRQGRQSGTITNECDITGSDPNTPYPVAPITMMFPSIAAMRRDMLLSF